MLTAGRRSGSILILACTMAGAMTAWVFLLGSPFTAIFPVRSSAVFSSPAAKT